MNTNEDFAKSVRAAVEDALKAREGEERAATIETALEKANDIVEKLTDSLKEKADALAAAEEEKTDLKSQLEELIAKSQELVGKLDEAEEKEQEALKRAEAAEAQLKEIALDKQLAERVAHLKENQISFEGERLEKQMASVKGLSEEEFAAYCEDLLELKKSIQESLKETAEEVEESEVEKEVAEESEELEVAPADLKAEKETASVLPNVEVTKTEGYKDRVARMGNKWADEIKLGRN